MPTKTKETAANVEIQPYLFFAGRCEEALEFYRGALGAEVQMVMRFDESPDPVPPDKVVPGWEKKIMHASFRVGGALVMASDGCRTDPVEFRGFSLAIAVHDAATADRLFKGLAKGGEVQMPMGETFWSPRFGMVTDRFGVGWMINLVRAQASPAS